MPTPNGLCDRHELFHVLGRSNEVAAAAKALFEIVAKFLEQMNMLCFLAGELQQRPNLVVVARQLRSGVVESDTEE